MYQLQTCFYYYYSLSPKLMSCSLFSILVVFTRDLEILVYLASKTITSELIESHCTGCFQLIIVGCDLISVIAVATGFVCCM